jgi:hypothetical protein
MVERACTCGLVAESIYFAGGPEPRANGQGQGYAWGQGRAPPPRGDVVR